MLTGGDFKMEEEILSLEKCLATTTVKWENWTNMLNQAPSLEDDLQHCSEKRHRVETELYVLTHRLGMLHLLQKPVDDGCNQEKTDMTLPESEEFLKDVTSINKENQNNIQDKTQKPIIQAVDELSKNLSCLQEKLAVLKEKQARVIGTDKQFGNGSTIRQMSSSIQVGKEKMVSDQQVAKLEKEMLEDRISRSEKYHQVASEGLKTARAEAVESETQLSSLQKKAATLEQLSGIRCFVVDDLMLEVTLLNDCLPVATSDYTFVATLVFALDEDECLVLSQVDTNQDICLPSPAIKSAIADNDLPRLVRILKEVSHSESALMSEISCLRKSHAIDWKPEERILHLMVGKCIVCRLTVPEKYPQSQYGCVTLDQIVGSPPGVTAESISLPDSSSLTQWITQLEAILSGNVNL